MVAYTYSSARGGRVMGFRFLICGGRNFAEAPAEATPAQQAQAGRERKLLFAVLDCYKEVIDVVIHGSASGADTAAERWAKARQVCYLGCPAEWDKYGKGAGPIRNKEMLTKWKLDRVIAFPGGNGTAHMVSIAKAAGLPVTVITGLKDLETVRLESEIDLAALKGNS